MKQNIVGLFLLCLGIILIFPILSGWILRFFILILGFHLFFAGLRLLTSKNKSNYYATWQQTYFHNGKHWKQ